MGSNLFLALGFLCSLLTIGYAVTVLSDLKRDKTDVSSLSATTAKKPLPAIELLEMHVHSEIALRYSRTSITKLFKNPANVYQETNFTVCLPESALISGFSMTTAGKKYESYVKEKDVRAGGASNIYDLSCRNSIIALQYFAMTLKVKAYSTVLMNLTYEELLHRQDGVYKHNTYLYPASKVDNLTIVVHINEERKITTPRLPEVTINDDTISTAGDARNRDFFMVTKSANGREITVVYKPDLNEQSRLMEIYKQKTRSLAVLVVQYDVDRSIENEILIDGGYFAHFYNSSHLRPPQKNIMFVLDLSTQSKFQHYLYYRDAVQAILEELHSGDYFSLIAYQPSAQVYDVNKSYLRQNISIFAQYFGVPPQNMDTAMNYMDIQDLSQKVINLREANGVEAMKIAVNLMQKNLIELAVNKHLQMKPLKDGRNYINGSVNIFDPMIIVLRCDVCTANYYELQLEENSFISNIYMKSRIFTLSRSDNYRDQKSARDIFKRISAAPVLNHINFTYPTSQIEEDSLTNTRFQTFIGDELMIMGRLKQSVKEVFPQIEFDSWFGPMLDHSYPIIVRNKTNLILERIWAHLSIKQLLEKYNKATHPDIKKKTLELALKYSFITDLTSLAVVAPDWISDIRVEVGHQDRFEIYYPGSPLQPGFPGLVNLLGPSFSGFPSLPFGYPSIWPTRAPVKAEEPPPAIVVLEIYVKSEIALRYSRTFFTQYLKNPAKIPQQTLFKVRLPEAAFVIGFSMTMGSKKYDAWVKSKEESNKHGLGAANITSHSYYEHNMTSQDNYFIAKVNVEANSTVLLYLTYEELLCRHDSVYQHEVYILPRFKRPNITVVVHIKENQNITTLRVQSTGDILNSYAHVTKSDNGREVIVAFQPTLKSWSTSDENELTNSPQQFVVQYDVDRTIFNEIMMSDGYFAHFYAPSSLPPINSHVVIVTDEVETSFSAIPSITILERLQRGDYFNIVFFKTSVQVPNFKKTKDNFFLHNFGEQKEKILILQHLSPVSPENIAQTSTVLSNLTDEDDGESIAEALDVALSVIQGGVKGNKTCIPAKKLVNEIKADFVTNLEGDENIKNLEPLIIVVSDRFTNKEKRITERIALDNSMKGQIVMMEAGEMYYTFALKEVLQKFYKWISFQMLTLINFYYSTKQVKQGSLTKTKFPIFEFGSEIIVAGQLDPTANEISALLCGRRGVFENNAKHHCDRQPVVTTLKEKREHLALERMWAYLTIKQLLRDTSKNHNLSSDEKASLKKTALELALKHSFVTELTSLEMTEPYDSSVTSVEIIDKPSEIISTSVSKVANETLNQLLTYHLDLYPWTKPLLNYSSGELVIQNNGTEIRLKLTKDLSMPLLEPDFTCSPPIEGGVGLCVYLTRCLAARDISEDLYASTFHCALDRYAGVCCPFDSIVWVGG